MTAPDMISRAEADRKTQEAAIAQEARMSDDLVKQSIAELQDIVHCDCGSAYLERGRHSHACLHYMADALKIVADRIEELEAKLAKAVGALESVMVGGNHLAILLPDNFLPAETEPLDALDMMGAGDAYEVWCCWRTIMLARTTLAELTGEKT